MIEIVDDNNPYSSLLGIEWDFDNNAIINLKKRQISFEDGTHRVTAPIDPLEGRRYVEPVKYEVDLDNIYNLTSNKEDYVDLKSDGKISRQSAISCGYDLEQDLENWKNRLHEVSTICCAHMKKSL